jgi:hypothetical protein
MFTLTSRTISRAAIVAVLSLAGAAAASVDPAMALCKYGTPHCVNPDPRPELPKVGGAEIPPSGWEDPDCKYFNNCNPGPDNWDDPAARKGPSGTQPGHIGIVHVPVGGIKQPGTSGQPVTIFARSGFASGFASSGGHGSRR